MPNHVTNILEFNCSRKHADEILTFLRKEDDVYGSIDFNKLIPMPESISSVAEPLFMSSSSVTVSL